jgi:hypothetical protein
MIFRSRKRRAATERQSAGQESGTEHPSGGEVPGTERESGGQEPGTEAATEQRSGGEESGTDAMTDNDVEGEPTGRRTAGAAEEVADTGSESDVGDQTGDSADVPPDNSNDEVFDPSATAEVADTAEVGDTAEIGDTDEVSDVAEVYDAGEVGDTHEPGDTDEPDDAEMDAETEEELSEAEMARLDAADWRDLGPYDIAETDIDNSELSDDPDHVDLGSMVLPVSEDLELQLQVEEESQQLVSAMLVMGDSALEVGAFAAPSSGGLWPEIRPELVDSVLSNGGSAALVPGPFGVELRRLLPVETPDGEQGYQPSRMWLAEGPRWMLRGIVYGEAALTEDIESPAGELLELFRQIVVRRGDEPMAPGDLLPIVLPPELADSPDVSTDGEAPDAGE